MSRKKKESAPLLSELYKSGERWWLSKEDVASNLNAHLDSLSSLQAGRLQQARKFLQQYEGGRKPGQSNNGIRTIDLVSCNVTANIIRALRAKVVKNRPKPWVLTEGGSQSQQDRAIGLQQFVEGVFYESSAYELGERVFDDWAKLGDGWAKVYADYDDGTIRIERVFPWEILIDDTDGFYGSPRSIYQVKHIDREVVSSLWPDQAVEVSKAPASKGADLFGSRSIKNVDQIEVREGWHLPSSTTSKDGRHVITIGGTEVILLDEPWERSSFPFVHFAGEPDSVGSHGVGIVEELYGIQLEINETVFKIQEAHELGGNVIIQVQPNAKVNKSKITNAPMTIVEAEGAIVPIPMPAVSAEVYQYLQSLIQRAYEIYGISQLSASAALPAGLQQASGKALRYYHDIESERFSYIIRAYERFFIDLGGAIIAAAKEAADNDSGFTVRYQGLDSIKRISWKKVAMDEKEYVIQIYPIAFLSQTPTSKQADILDLLKMGVITPQEARTQMSYPDPAGNLDTYEASRRLAKLQIESMLQDGVPEAAENFQDLNLTLTLAIAAYCDARAKKDIPDENLQLIRDFISDIQARLAPPPAPPMPQQVPPEMVQQQMAANQQIPQQA